MQVWSREDRVGMVELKRTRNIPEDMMKVLFSLSRMTGTEGSFTALQLSGGGTFSR